MEFDITNIISQNFTPIQRHNINYRQRSPRAQFIYDILKGILIAHLIVLLITFVGSFFI